jgi:aspartate dehydrogenase
VKKVGIIGCGAIGTLIAEAVGNGIVKCDGLILYDYNNEKADQLARSLTIPVKAVRSLDEMIKLKPSVIVEAASQQAAKEYIRRILKGDIELIVMSVGALLDLDVRSSKIHIPSGAIGGLDAIASAALAGISEVVLTTRKNPKVLDMNNREEKLVYEGTAREAVKLFPREINVAAALALAASPEKVKVRIVSDPKVTRNVHEVKVKWKHGEMLLRFENEPHPENPRTSALAAWSAMRLLREILQRNP